MSLKIALAICAIFSSVRAFILPSTALCLVQAGLPKSVRHPKIASFTCQLGDPSHKQQAQSLFASLGIKPTEHNIEVVSGKIKNNDDSLKRQERQKLNHFLNDLIAFLYYLKRLNKHDHLTTLKQGIVNKDLSLINTFIQKTKDTFTPSVLTNSSTPDKIKRFYLTPHNTILNRFSDLLTSTDKFTAQVKNNLLMALQSNLKQNPPKKDSRSTFPLGQLIILNALSQNKLNSHFKQLSMIIDYLKSQNDITTLKTLFNAIKTRNEKNLISLKEKRAFNDHFFNYLLALLHYDYSTDLQSVSQITKIEQHRRAVLTLLNKTMLDM